MLANTKPLSYSDYVQGVRKLKPEEPVNLLEVIRATLKTPTHAKHRIMELEGSGAEIWEVFLSQDVKGVIMKYNSSPPDTIYNAYGISEDGRYLEIGYVKETAFRDRIIDAMDMRASIRKRFKKMRKL